MPEAAFSHLVAIRHELGAALVPFGVGESPLPATGFPLPDATAAEHGNQDGKHAAD